MKKCLRILLLFAVLAVSFSALPAFPEEELVLTEAPLSPAYLQWLKDRENGDLEKWGGRIPFPADFSHLADNPPDESLGQGERKFRATSIPTKYDLRSVGGKSYVTSVKNQNPYGTCWAHASIGAMESNYLVQGGSELNLSEMHLAWFTYINTVSKDYAFENHTWNSTSGQVQASASESRATILDHGGNAFFPAALYGRLDGPVLEDEMKYPNAPSSTAVPGDYTRVLRLREIYHLGFNTYEDNVNESPAQRDIVKQRIMDSGAVFANYYENSSTGLASDKVSYYAGKNKTPTPNHAVLLIGWDDSYSRSKFKNNPGMDGAWLVKNSWGTSFGDNGYFWISYAQYLEEGAAFIVEPVNHDLKAYFYDPLGWTGGSVGWRTSDVYMANSFKAARDEEKVIDVGFYTSQNNQKYEITVYTGQGTSMPSSPVSGTKALTMTGTIPYAGYHTVTLTNQVSVTKGQYFSVVLKYEGLSMVPLADKRSGMSDNYVYQDGSFFSPNGSSWTKGKDVLSKANAPLKAFTVSTGENTKPNILTGSLPDAALNASYSVTLTAIGKQPITWSAQGLPAGLSISSSTGQISGTPTAEGTFDVTITASNSLGSTSKEYTLTVNDLPVISPTTIEAYAGYDANTEFTLTPAAAAQWSAVNLPSGLKINASTGKLTGKPSKAGTYSFTVSAKVSAGTSTASVTMTVNAKPTKPTIKTSKLTQINVGQSVNEKLQVTGTEPITVSVTDGMPEGLNFDVDTWTFSGTPAAGTYKITVQATNIVNELTGGKPVEKKINFVVKGIAPKIDAPSSFPDGRAGEVYPTQTLTLSSGSAVEKWTATGLPRGLTIGATTGIISGTPAKDGIYNVVIQAQNNGGKDKTGKIPLIVLDEPEITLRKLTAATTDKKYSLKLTAKGTPTKWRVSGLPDTLAYSEDKKGNPLIAGTPVEVATYQVTIVASNDVGHDTKTLPLEVKGVAPNIKTTFPKGTVGAAYSAAVTVAGTKPFTKLTYTIEAKDAAKHGISTLEEIGLTFTPDVPAGTATITGTPNQSVKGLPVMIVAENVVKEVSKKGSLTLAGKKPAFTSPTAATVKLSGAQGSTVTVDFAVTGTDKITWDMKTTAGFTLTVNASDPRKATLTATVPAKKTTVTVNVSNADGKVSKKVDVSPAASAASLRHEAAPENFTEGPEAQEPEKTLQDDADAEVRAITFGEARNVNALSPSERGVIAHEGYKIVAVLPELKAEADGMYDLDVELDEDAPVGRELVWLAFPQNAEASEDDEIAEFSDETGEETLTVPESRHVRVSVWLRAGITYAPVIAVK